MTSRQTFRIVFAPLMAALALSLTAHGQQPSFTVEIPNSSTSQGPGAPPKLAFFGSSTEQGEGQDARQKIVLDLVTASNPVVKGKPYAAETSTETVQTLADGNRIVNRSASKFYRDSQGRTRREETFGNVDPSESAPHEVKIFIDDPVGNIAYILDPGDKSARQTARLMSPSADRDSDSHAPRMLIQVKTDRDPLMPSALPPLPPIPALPRLNESHDIVKEDLGKRTIEGVECTGTQQTITIPANQVGNERPIAIVTETWYSPAIEAVVQSTTTDPRFGQTTYQLRNLQVKDQPLPLFTLPSDYHVDGPRK